MWFRSRYRPDGPLRVMLSGGGTGGHIYPAVSLAQCFKERYPKCQVAFVGALGKMEMRLVPEAGFTIYGLWISGLQRKLDWRNLLLPLKLLWSMVQCKWLLLKHRPHLVIGTGGYASLPLMGMALIFGIPIFLQEQNAILGLSNRMLSRWAKAVFVAFPDMEARYPSARIMFTGNPVRISMHHTPMDAGKARTQLGLDPQRPVLMVTGGSQGSRTLNQCVRDGLPQLKQAGIQVYWQAGVKQVREYTGLEAPGVKVLGFIKDMDRAYAAASLVVSRAGASTISELALQGKAVCFVPFPYAAEDHQWSNAQALAKLGAAEVVRDTEAPLKLIPKVLEMMSDGARLAAMEQNIKGFARPRAATDIVEHCMKVLA